MGRAIASLPSGRVHSTPRRRIHVIALHMIWKSDQGARGYHHGNLKEALIQAALDLIAAKGPSGFTFAEAARSAGVSPAAPYRHFRDREELIANVARRGFELFEAALKTAWQDGRPDPSTAFERLGRAYLDFARTEPAYYSAMFEAGIPLEASQELREAGDRAFAVLRIRRGGAGGADSRGQPAAGLHGGAACVVARPRHRLAVRARRSRPSTAADGAGRAPGGGRARLSARPWISRRRRAALTGALRAPFVLPISPLDSESGLLVPM